MTAPDPTPFLRPGVDLITAEDVVVWLWDRERGPASAGARSLATSASVLEARLDRERRQACRRAVAHHLCTARAHRANERAWTSAAPGESHPDEWIRAARESRANAVRVALAFRAAARAQ